MEIKMSFSSHRIKGIHYQRDLSPLRFTLIIELEVMFVRFLTVGYFLSAFFCASLSKRKSHSSVMDMKALLHISKGRVFTYILFHYL